MKQLMLVMWFVFNAAMLHGQASTDVAQQEDSETTSLESQLPAQTNPSTTPGTREYAEERINIRKFDEKRWRDIVEGSNYTDTRTRKNAADQNAGEGGRDRYDYDDEGSGMDLSWLGPVAQIIFYAIIIVIIAVILVQIIRNTSFKSNPKKKSVASGVPDEIHDITELDTEGLIQKAQHANDFKLAIRLYFLDLLKKLNEHGAIVWTKDKTNRDFLSELFSKQYYFDEIRRLTLAYEHVWYGEHIPTEERYHQLKNEFQEVRQKFKAS